MAVPASVIKPIDFAMPLLSMANNRNAYRRVNYYSLGSKASEPFSLKVNAFELSVIIL